MDGENAQSQWNEEKEDFHWMLSAKDRGEKRDDRGAELFQIDKSEATSCSRRGQGEDVGFENLS